MNILVFQHIAVEDPGIFLEFWAAAGHRWHSVELDAGAEIPALADFDLLVVMGGPMDVWQEDALPWLRLEKAAIRDWVVGLGKPFLGVCLGHQLLAEALGGEVTLMAEPEVGLADVSLTSAGLADPLFAGFAATVETFQWHGAQVSKLPLGATVLAENAACGVQAYRWGTHAYGLQYHVEITASTVAEWARIPEYTASLIRALGAENAASLASVVAARLPSFRAAAERLHQNLTHLLAPMV